MQCEPACAYVTHYVPSYGLIHHALTCPNHPQIQFNTQHVQIPASAKLPQKLAVQARRDAVCYWWERGQVPAELAERFCCSVETIHDDIRLLRVLGRIGHRPRQPVTLETLRNERPC